MHHLSKGEIRSNCFKRKYEFQLSAYQLAILLAFNDKDVLSNVELTSLTNLKDNDLIRTVDVPIFFLLGVKKLIFVCLVTC